MSDSQANLNLLGEAIAGLRIRDIVLFASRLERPAPPPVDSDSQVLIQTKRQVRFERGELSENDEVVTPLVRVFVDLGLRIVDADDSDPTVFVLIEADFMAEYALTGEVSDGAMAAFAELNSVHNVWPFWRQHVFDVVQRARLPSIEVPLFSGSPAPAPASAAGKS